MLTNDHADYSSLVPDHLLLLAILTFPIITMSGQVRSSENQQLRSSRRYTFKYSTPADDEASRRTGRQQAEMNESGWQNNIAVRSMNRSR